MKFFKSRSFLVSMALILFLFAYFSGLKDLLTLNSIQTHLGEWQNLSKSNPLSTALIFFVVYVVGTALSIPGASALTLLGGALFGTILGFLIVSFASTIGATLAFLGTRYIFREWVENKFPEKIAAINSGVRTDGVFYLLSLRLAPVVPFFLVNMLMGLTQMSLFKYFVVSQLGMIPGTIAYVFAGQELGKITTLAGLISPSVLTAFIFLALVPWMAKGFLYLLNHHRLYKPFKKPKKFDYNMIVIGGGAAGLVTSYIAAAVKAKVALVEKHKMGGDCLNYGCVPSKALIKSAKTAHAVHHAAKYGVTSSSANIDFQQVMKRLQKVITEIEPHDSVERYTKLGVDCFQDSAKIISPYEVKIGDSVYTTKNIVIATGAQPFIPKIAGIELIRPLTSETLWSLTEQPKRLLILGGGAIGCELAQAFQRLGSQVTLVEKSQHLMARADDDVIEILESTLKSEGVHLLLGGEVFELSANTAKVKSVVGTQEIAFDQVIFALGRKARVDGFGLSELGIVLNDKGFIEHDEFLATKYPNIFVCGDCAGPYQLTHVAAHQAWYAALNGLFAPFKKFKEDLRVIPSVTFTDPEISQVGITEKEARERNIKIVVTKYDIADLDRAICDGENKGFVKVLTAEGSDQILGATIVAAHSGEFLAELVLAMKHKLGLNKVLGTIHSYPTWAESNKYVAGQWKAKTAPVELLKWVEMFHRWRRS